MSMSLSGNRGPAGNKVPKGYSAGRLQQFTPDMMNLFQSLFPHVAPGSQLSNLAQGDESSFGPMEQRATRDFQEFQGQLGSRFSELAPGAMSSRKSGAFNRLATQGAQDFASQLAEKRQGLQRQALMDLMGISTTLLGQQPYQNFLIQKQQKPSFWGKLFGTVAPVAGATIGGTFGGPAGAHLGASLGGSFGQGFNSF